MANFITKKFKSGFAQFVGTLTGSESILIKKDGTSSPFWITLTNLLAGYATDQNISDLDTRISTNETDIQTEAQNIINEASSRLQADASLSSQIATKVIRQPLVSITGTIQATAGGQYAYDPATKKINVSGSNLMWGIQTTPSNGVIYTFNGTNYVWNSSELIEIGTGGGGTGIKTIAADDLTFFDTFLNSGFYENTGGLGGTYTGLFTSPFVKQRIDTIDKIYIRTVDVSVPGAPKPNFTIYGSTTPAPVVVEASELKLILGHLSYTIKADDPDNWKISADTDGGSIIFPSLGGVTKSITFIVPATSYPILFNGVSIAAGNTVFAIYTLNAWTIDSTIVEIPVIPNYSDISVQKKIDADAYLSARADGTFMCLVPSVVDSAQNDKIFLSSQDEKSQIGIYQVIIKRSNYVLLKLIVSGTSLNTIRVSGVGTFENKYDGFDLATIAFEKIVTPPNLSAYETIASNNAKLGYKADKAGREVFSYALSDQISAITTGMKITDTIDSNFQLTDILVSLMEAATGGIFTVNIKKNTVTIFTTKITIDATETSNLTAAIPFVFSSTPMLFSIGDRLEISIDAVGGVLTGKGATIKGKGIK